MKIIVTGGAGFIGGNFVHHMVNKYPDYEIINLDLLTYAGNLETLKPVEDKPNYKFVKGDIADRKFIFDLFEKEKPDVIVNFAAESHVDRSITDPESFVRTNVMGTTTLLDACREFGIQEIPSGIHRRGVRRPSVRPPGLILHRGDSASHLQSILFLQGERRFIRTRLPQDLRTPVTISRCSNNYGPYHFPEKLIPLIISRALADEELRSMEPAKMSATGSMLRITARPLI